MYHQGRKMEIQSRLSKDSKYPLETLVILEGLLKEGGILRKVPNLKYAEYDLNDRAKLICKRKILQKVWTAYGDYFIIEQLEWD